MNIGNHVVKFLVCCITQDKTEIELLSVIYILEIFEIVSELSKNDFVKELKFVLDLEGRLKGHF
jgi:hypothetical protein